jgi:hypothetical protein
MVGGNRNHKTSGIKTNSQDHYYFNFRSLSKVNWTIKKVSHTLQVNSKQLYCITNVCGCNTTSSCEIQASPKNMEYASSTFRVEYQYHVSVR